MKKIYKKILYLKFVFSIVDNIDIMKEDYLRKLAF